MRSPRFISFALIALIALACRDPLTGAPKPTSLPLDPAWGTDPRWSDGAAEIARYDASQTVRNAPRAFQAVLLTVKEPFNLEKMAKSDEPSKAKRVADAIRMSMAFDFPTSADPRHFLGCVQIRADSPGRLLRQTISSQEMGGSTYKEFARHGSSGRYIWRSFWEEEGSGERPVPLDATHLTEEQLFLLVRALAFKPGLKFAAAVYPPQFSNRAPAPDPQSMKFDLAEGEDFELEGRTLKTWRIDGESSEKKGEPRRLQYLVGKEFPHPLLSFQSSDGLSLRLTKLERGKP